MTCTSQLGRRHMARRCHFRIGPSLQLEHEAAATAWMSAYRRTARPMSSTDRSCSASRPVTSTTRAAVGDVDVPGGCVPAGTSSMGGRPRACEGSILAATGRFLSTTRPRGVSDARRVRRRTRGERADQREAWRFTSTSQLGHRHRRERRVARRHGHRAVPLRTRRVTSATRGARPRARGCCSGGVFPSTSSWDIAIVANAVSHRGSAIVMLDSERGNR